MARMDYPKQLSDAKQRVLIEALEKINGLAQFMTEADDEAITLKQLRWRVAEIAESALVQLDDAERETLGRAKL